MRLSLLVDTRAHPRHDAATRALLRTTATQCGELLSLCRLVNGGGGVTVSVRMATFEGVFSVAPDTPVAEGEQGLQRLLRALEVVERREPDCSPSPGAVSTNGDGIAVLRPWLYSPQDHCVAQGPNGRRDNVFLLATAYLSYTELFSALAHVGSAAPPYVLHCVTVSAEAMGVATASLGSSGTLYCCSADPPDLRAALQASLGGLLLSGGGRPAHAGASARAEDGVLPVTVALCLGVGLRLCCEAQRPYWGPPLRCCTADRLSPVHEEAPSLVFQSGVGGVALAHSGFEVDRLEGSGGAVLLTLEAVLAPENVDEAFLGDNSWVLSPSGRDGGGSADAALFGAAFSQFSKDVLVLRCGSGSSRLAAPHALALRRTCYAAYFLGRTRLMLRQITPIELRRVPIAPPPLRTRDDDAVAAAQMKAIRAELVARCRDPTFSLDSLLQGGVCLIAAQLRSEKEYSLHLVKAYR